MSSYAFVNYVRFKNASNQYLGAAYQNFAIGQELLFQQITHKFAPFAVSSGGGSKGGDRSSAAIAAGLDALSVNLFAEAVKERYSVEIVTVSLDPIDGSNLSVISSENWSASSYQMDTEKIVLQLTSPLDAVRSNVPRRTLSSRLVGALPLSGTLVIG